MERLTDEEREALVEIGEPGAGPISGATFRKLEERGWGFWGPNPESNDPVDVIWRVTPEGRRALELDTLARQAEIS